MDKKLKTLVENLKDERGGKIIFVAHCILNENTRYLGGAFRKGGVNEIVTEIQKQDFGIVQMQCPEAKAWGGVLKKWMWLAVGRGDSILYRFKGLFLPLFLWHTRRVFRRIACEVAAEIKDYVDSGFTVSGIVGIDGSPSCGVNVTVDIGKSAEFLAGTNAEKIDRQKMNEIGVKGCSEPGEGLFIKALKAELEKKNIPVKFYGHNLLAEMSGETARLEIKD